MERYLDTSSIPKKSESRYDWKNSIGCSLFFKYGEHSGHIEIKDYIIKDNYRNKLLIDINGKEKEINPHSLITLDIGDFFGVCTHDFKYDIGYIFGKTNNKMKIVSRHRNPVKTYHTRCLTCGYEKNIKESNVTTNKGCPVCDNKIIIHGINDMWTTNPELAKLLANPNDGYKYSQHSQKKLIWKCPFCNSNSKPLSVDYISIYGLHCPKCSDGFSYPNKFIFNLLTELNIDFVPEQIFEWSEHRLYDFYLPQYDCIIEAHCMQHYRDGYFTDFEDVHKNDIFKRKLALDNGIKKYIVVDCRFSKPDFIFQSICKSDLKDFIDITKIDINKIDLLCQKNILSYVVDLYEKNYNTHQIEKMTKLSKSQICRLLNKANDLELIQYNKYKFKQEATKKAQITLYQNNAKPIKCLENGYVFGTCTIAAQNSKQIFGKKMLMTTIYNAINSKKTAYGYKFVFIARDEFNSTKAEHPNMAFGDYFKSIHNSEVA